MKKRNWNWRRLQRERLRNREFLFPGGKRASGYLARTRQIARCSFPPGEWVVILEHIDYNMSVSKYIKSEIWLAGFVPGRYSYHPTRLYPGLRAACAPCPQ